MAKNAERDIELARQMMLNRAYMALLEGGQYPELRILLMNERGHLRRKFNEAGLTEAKTNKLLDVA